MNLEEFITSKAFECGFGAVGIATVSPCLSIERYNLWLKQNKHGTMSYLERGAELRADPRNLLPEAKSIIVVAVQYPVNPSPSSGIAMYARFPDYHVVIRKKLKTLVQSIESELSRKIRARICVDSAPLLEREWAVRAGIGWIGKQGQVVNQNLGACILLGEVLLDVELRPSVLPGTEIQNDMCGNCNKCIESCPAAAIEPDRTVDARKCIAYLTVEHEGDLPAEFHEKIGKRIFGCDTCTAVCPWNHNGNKKLMPEFTRPLITDLDPEEILEMSEFDFRQKFKNTVLIRTGLDRLKRNIKKMV
jgi:epoxyqueuosine reductase